jgi:hypothetical protein
MEAVKENVYNIKVQEFKNKLHAQISRVRSAARKK